MKDTLEVSTKASGSGERTVLTPLQVLGSVVAIIAVLIAAGTAVGSFAWTLPSLAESASANGGAVNADDIRGSMSFEEVATATGIPGSAFRDRFKVSETDMGAPMKDIAETYGFDVHIDVRAFVNEQLATAK